MNDDRSLERAARSWIERGPTQAPEGAVRQALFLIETTRQERDLWIPWRTSPMTRIALAGAAVATLVALAIGGTLGLGLPPDGPITGATATPGLTDGPTTSPDASEQTAPPPGSDAVILTDGWVANDDGANARNLFPTTMFVDLIDRTADGRQVLTMLREGQVPEFTLALVDIETGERHPVPTECPTEPCWADDPLFVLFRGALSADGRFAAFVLTDQRTATVAIATVDLRSGATTVLETTREPVAVRTVLFQPTFSPDGQSIAYIRPDVRCLLPPEGGALLVVSRFGDTPPRQLLPADQCAMNPKWSPTGDELVVTTGEPVAAGDPSPREYHDIYVVPLEGGTPDRVTTDRMSTFGAWTRDGRISYAVMPLDAGNMPLGLDVRIQDPSTGASTRVEGTLQALGDAGCLECPFVRNGSEVKDLVMALWRRD